MIIIVISNKQPLYDFVNKISLESIYGENKNNPVDETKKLLDAFDNPQNSFKTIHIAGTNGKTSTSHYLFNILKNSGYKVGLYFSPHIYTFEERIQTQDGLIPYDEVFSLMQETYHKAKEIGIKYAGFPIIAAVTAFRYFKKENVKFVVLETGVGGLLDPTNSVKGDYGVITNIGLDHTHLLGKTIEEIARHKFGIIKENMKIASCCTNINQYLIEKKFKYVKCINSSLKHEIILGEPIIQDNHFMINYFYLPKLDMTFKNLALKTIGYYQIDNLYNVLTICYFLKEDGYVLDNDIIKTSIMNTIVLGRLQLIDDNILLDGSHNEMGLKSLVESIHHYYPNKELVVLSSSKKNKDIQLVHGYLQQISSNITYTEMKHDGGKVLSDMKSILPIDSSYYENPLEAFDSLKKDLKENQLLVVTGSLYLMAQIQNYLKNKNTL